MLDKNTIDLLRKKFSHSFFFVRIFNHNQATYIWNDKTIYIKLVDNKINNIYHMPDQPIVVKISKDNKYENFDPLDISTNIANVSSQLQSVVNKFIPTTNLPSPQVIQTTIQTTNSPIPTTNLPIPTTNSPILTTNSPIPTTNSPLPQVIQTTNVPSLSQIMSMNMQNISPQQQSMIDNYIQPQNNQVKLNVENNTYKTDKNSIKYPNEDSVINYTGNNCNQKKDILNNTNNEITNSNIKQNENLCKNKSLVQQRSDAYTYMKNNSVGVDNFPICNQNKSDPDNITNSLDEIDIADIYRKNQVFIKSYLEDPIVRGGNIGEFEEYAGLSDIGLLSLENKSHPKPSHYIFNTSPVFSR